MNSDARERAARANDAPELTEFLRELRRRSALTARTELAELECDVRQVSAAEDLAARFTEAARSAGLRLHQVAESDWIASVREILTECGAKTVFVQAAQTDDLPAQTQSGPHSGPYAAENAEFDVALLMTTLARSGIVVHTDSSDETLFSVDAGITGVECAIAETGTLVCQSGSGRARGGSLIPPLHIALVQAAQIVPDLYDALAKVGARPELPANVNLITGPSKTADIEGILVTGVHGPREVHVVLVGGPVVSQCS